MLNKLKLLIAGLGVSPYLFLSVGGIFLVIFGVIFIGKFCAKKEVVPKLNQAEILAAQEAVKTKNETKMRDILANSDRRVQAVDGEVSAAEANTRAITNRSYDHLSASQLAAEIERRKHQ